MARRTKGEGSLYQTKDKTWVYQYNEDGKRKTKRFQRKADAKAFMDAFAASIPQQGAVGVPRGQVITVGEWMDRWLEKYAKPSVKLSTYCSYELHIRDTTGKAMFSARRMDSLMNQERTRICLSVVYVLPVLMPLIFTA